MTERPIGTMVTYGYPGVELTEELCLAQMIGATLLEILPDWSRWPLPEFAREQAAASGMSIHSAHGCWGGRTIRAQRVDLGATDALTHRESIDDLKRCADWVAAAGGKHLVVHPGGLAQPNEAAARRAALATGLGQLGDHARPLGVIVCVENMPPGVYPGSRMADLADLLRELKHPQLALALDTGHANISASLAGETHEAGPLLATTHVHDNNGRQDSHEPPGHGNIDWPAWGRALDAIQFKGPIVLECIKRVRQDRSSYLPQIVDSLRVIGSTAPARSDRL